LADPSTAAGALLATGIKPSNLYWLFGESPFVRPLTDHAALASNAADFEKVAAFAKAIGATTIFVLPGVAHPRQKPKDLIATSAEALDALVPIAQAHGVTLTIEPHVGGILTSPEATLALLDAVPGLKLTLDYAHFVAMGYPQAAIDPLAPHAAHVHLRQARPGALQSKLAQGTLDFVAMIETLRAASYDGYLAVEVVHQDYMNTLFDDVLTETIQLKTLISPSLP
ncbi:MAG: sugar phosphate isomerase/epimerase family protein, partial [Pseudomonadota bacterium]